MHFKRWVTAVVALPFVIAIIIAGGAVFTGFLCIVCIVALWEYYRITYYSLTPRPKTPLDFLGYVTGCLMILAAAGNAAGLILCLLAVNLLLGGGLISRYYRHHPDAQDWLSIQVKGVVYIPLALALLMLIRVGDQGTQWIFLLLCVIFAGDTGAYYVGKNYGRRKLCPSVSPGKTVEGALGGIAANIVVGSLAKLILLPSLGWTMSLMFFVSAGVAGQAGDLFESVLKRSAGIKDSSNILPGHGGILDRIDALIMAGPIAYFFKMFIF
jgi:phosphatidate cytidylyltransferase